MTTRDEHIKAAENWLRMAEELWDSAERDQVDPSEALAAAAIATAHSSLAASLPPDDFITAMLKAAPSGPAGQSHDGQETTR